jgi:hypothetical protein
MSVLPADIVNRALDAIGNKNSVGDLQEGTTEARVGLRIYSQIVQFVLGQRDWAFARDAVDLKQLKTAPIGGYGMNVWDPLNNPPPPWQFEFAYPDGTIKVRSVRPVPAVTPEYAPRFNAFVEAYDSDLAQKVILTNLPDAQAVITLQVMDPNEWQDPMFTEAVIAALAAGIERSLRDPADQAAQREQAAQPRQQGQRGQ